MKTKPLCPECRHNNSIARPSLAEIVAGQTIMSYRCRNCGSAFSDLTGVTPPSGNGNTEPTLDPNKKHLSDMTDEERAAEIKRVLQRIAK